MRISLAVRLAIAFAGASLLAHAQDASTPEEVALTVGRDGRSIVREVRSAQLAGGRSSLRVLDVAPRLLPETVTLRALSQPDLVRLSEQTAWFEVLNVEKALESLAGRPVELLRFHEATVERLEGRLLFPPVVGSPAGELKLPLYLEQIDGQIRLFDEAEIVLDALPSGDWNRMRLDWRLDCDRADRYRFELLYATRGLSWSCDWQLRANAEGSSGDLSVVVSVVNQSGVAFKGARLAVQDETMLHPVADVATLAREATLQVVLAQLRDAALTTTPTYVVPGIDGPSDSTPVVRRFDFAADSAARIGRALPAGNAQTIVLDARNRPWLSPTTAVAATLGDALPSFFGEPIAGIRGRCNQESTGPHSMSYRVVLTSTRADTLDVDVAIPLATNERIVEPAMPQRRSADHAFVRTRVGSAAPSTVTIVVDRS